MKDLIIKINEQIAISPEQCRHNRANNACADEQCRARQHNADTWDAIAEVWEIMRADSDE